MLITEFYYGQGLGNQLAVYITTRCIAERNGYDFGFIGLENFGDRRYNDNGLYFMDLDLGKPVDITKITNYYKEKEIRFITNKSHHDSTIGCDIRLTDWNLLEVADNTKIDGIMQSEDYFYNKKNNIKDWLKLKPEYDNKEFSRDDICVLNIRDYGFDPALSLPREYWVNAINHMLKLNPEMIFVVITENTTAANQLLPELTDNTFHFDVGRDYATIKNAKWLVVSNSSFAYFPAFTNDTANLIIAPKYWARHNVSDGYWATGTNLYRDFTYMDRDGNLQSYDECQKEFEEYILNNKKLYS